MWSDYIASYFLHAQHIQVTNPICALGTANVSASPAIHSSSSLEKHMKSRMPFMFYHNQHPLISWTFDNVLSKISCCFFLKITFWKSLLTVTKQKSSTQILLLGGNSDINLYLTTNLKWIQLIGKKSIFFEWVAFTGFTNVLQYIFSAQFTHK